VKTRDVAVPAVVALFVVGAVAHGHPARTDPAGPTPSRANIVTVAQQQLHHGSCAPGYYRSCGTRWCAEFVRWVWSRAGVTATTGLNAYAQSFQTYGQRNRTWHPRAGYSPRPGDAVVFDWDHLPAGNGRGYDPYPIDHVAIVVATGGGRLSTIGGDQGGRDTLGTVSAATYSAGSASIVGYVSPAGADPA
jgi:hypothetical protein